MTDFHVGVDLGQSNDPTAIAILERIEKQEPLGSPVWHLRRSARPAPPVYHVRHLERMPLMTSYPAVVRHVRQMVERIPTLDRVSLTIDHTGVGRPVFDMFGATGLSCRLYGVTITGGDTVQRDGSSFRVPKRDLIGITQVLLQSERLKIAAALPEAAVLTKELLNFKVKIDPQTAHDSYSAWREGIHEDLVLALALACWMAERMGDGTITATWIHRGG